MKKQKSGLYRTKVRIGFDADGKPVDKWISAHTKAEVEEKRAQIVRTYIGGTESTSDTLFGVYATEWFDNYKRPFLSNSTRRIRVSQMNHYVLPAFGEKRLRAITRMDCQQFANSLAEMAPVAVSTIYGMLRSIIRQAVADGILSRDVTEGVKIRGTDGKRSKRPLTPEERAAFERIAENDISIALLYYTGMRNGEMRALLWSDIDLRSRMIHITKGLDDAGRPTNAKNKYSHRSVPIPARLAEILQSRQQLPSAPVSGIRSGSDMRRHFKQVLASEKLDPMISPHYLRHNFITLMWENGVDVVTTSKLVGHASIRETAEIYTHLTDTHSKTIASRLDTVFGQ